MENFQVQCCYRQGPSFISLIRSLVTPTFCTDVFCKRKLFWVELREKHRFQPPACEIIYLNGNGFMTQMSFRNLLLCLNMTYEAFQVGSRKLLIFLAIAILNSTSVNIFFIKLYNYVKSICANRSYVCNLWLKQLCLL